MRDTYFYFGSSLAATAGTAAAIYRSPAAMNLVIVACQVDRFMTYYLLSIKLRVHLTVGPSR